MGKKVMFYDNLSFPIFRGVSEGNEFLHHYSIYFDKNGNVIEEYTNDIFKKIGKEKWMKKASKRFKKLGY